MEYIEALELKEKWGKNPCNHPHFEKVYYAGAFLINYACTQCGADFTIAQKLEIDELRKEAVKELKGLKSNSVGLESADLI